MSNYLQVLESPLTRDRVTLIPQDKKAIALSILKLRKNPSDTRSKSVIRERINVTGDRLEKRELERILSFAECPVYSDTQKGHLEMAQNIGLHWANKIIAKHSEAVIESFANDFDWDVRNKSTHEDLKSEFQDRLSNYFDNVSPDMAETEKAIAKKLSGLDNLIGPIKYEDWTDTTPADTRFQESVTERFFDYADENIGLITKEIQEKQSANRKEIIKTSTTQLNKLSENIASEVFKDFLAKKDRNDSDIIEELAEGYDADLTDATIKNTILDHLIDKVQTMTSEDKNLSRQIEAIADRFDEHASSKGSVDAETYFGDETYGNLDKLITSNIGDIRKTIKQKQDEQKAIVTLSQAKVKQLAKDLVTESVNELLEGKADDKHSSIDGFIENHKNDYKDFTDDEMLGIIFDDLAEVIETKSADGSLSSQLDTLAERTDRYIPDGVHNMFDDAAREYLEKMTDEEIREKIGVVRQRIKETIERRDDPSNGIAKGHDYKNYTEKEKLQFRKNWFENADYNTDEEGDDDLDKWAKFADDHGWDAEDIDVKLGYA